MRFQHRVWNSKKMHLTSILNFSCLSSVAQWLKPVSFLTGSHTPENLDIMLKKLEAANVESMSLLSMLRRTKVDLASRDTREVAR